jgi:hypothetical protein
MVSANAGPATQKAKMLNPHSNRMAHLIIRTDGRQISDWLRSK